jgi:hypothetical protein
VMTGRWEPGTGSRRQEPAPGQAPGIWIFLISTIPILTFYLYIYILSGTGHWLVTGWLICGMLSGETH